MIKKITLALATMALPLMLLSGIASAHCGHWKHHHHHYWKTCCEYGMGYYGYGYMNPLANRVSREITADPSLYDQDISVTAHCRTVVLNGVVNTMAEKQRAIDIARYTRGVALVVDRLYVKGYR